jgi:hypothetical protein
MMFWVERMHGRMWIALQRVAHNADTTKLTLCRFRSEVLMNPPPHSIGVVSAVNSGTISRQDWWLNCVLRCNNVVRPRCGVVCLLIVQSRSVKVLHAAMWCVYGEHCKRGERSFT